MWSGFYSYTSLLKQCSHALLPTITNIINQSISTGFLPDQFKSCSIFSSSPQKANLDKGDLINYRPIYHLALLSKLTERVVKLSLTEYLSNNNLILNSFQTAYFYQTSFFWMSHQKITCLTLLDLSAAFDTIDHTFPYSPWASLCLVWYQFYCSLLYQILSPQSLFQTLRHYRAFSIICLPTNLWYSSRLCSWSSSLHLVHHSS